MTDKCAGEGIVVLEVRLLSINTAYTKGKNGFLHTTGETMYSILSDEIHCYRGEEYKFGDNGGWTEVMTEVLRVLKPLEANIDAETHEVN